MNRRDLIKRAVGVVAAAPLAVKESEPATLRVGDITRLAAATIDTRTDSIPIEDWCTGKARKIIEVRHS